MAFLLADNLIRLYPYKLFSILENASVIMDLLLMPIDRKAIKLGLDIAKP